MCRAFYSRIFLRVERLHAMLKGARGFSLMNYTSTPYMLMAHDNAHIARYTTHTHTRALCNVTLCVTTLSGEKTGFPLSIQRLGKPHTAPRTPHIGLAVWETNYNTPQTPCHPLFYMQTTPPPRHMDACGAAARRSTMDNFSVRRFFVN